MNEDVKKLINQKLDEIRTEIEGEKRHYLAGLTSAPDIEEIAHNKALDTAISIIDKRKEDL